MNFQQFQQSTSKIEKLDLPGESAQYKMAPIERLAELKRQALQKQTARKAAVMALFYPDDNQQTHIVLILRKTYRGVHSNQVGFPGGKVEPEDASLLHTALRETQEEVGVNPAEIKVIKPLTDIFIPPSNFVVHPFIGYSESRLLFTKQDEEVEDIIEVALSHFLDDEILTQKTLTTSYATDIKVPAYLLNGHVVWGATAMILSEIRYLLTCIFKTK